MRPSWDAVVADVCGDNYVSVDSGYAVDIMYSTPKLGRFDGSLGPEAYTESEFKNRLATVETVEDAFLEALPELESSRGVELWASWAQPKEEPPALYVGLYEPPSSQVEAIASALRGVAEEEGVAVI